MPKYRANFYGNEANEIAIILMIVLKTVEERTPGNLWLWSEIILNQTLVIVIKVSAMMKRWLQLRRWLWIYDLWFSENCHKGKRVDEEADDCGFMSGTGKALRPPLHAAIANVGVKAFMCDMNCTICLI